MQVAGAVPWPMNRFSRPRTGSLESRDTCHGPGGVSAVPPGRLTGNSLPAAPGLSAAASGVAGHPHKMKRGLRRRWALRPASHGPHSARGTGVGEGLPLLRHSTLQRPATPDGISRPVIRSDLRRPLREAEGTYVVVTPHPPILLSSTPRSPLSVQREKQTSATVPEVANLIRSSDSKPPGLSCWISVASSCLNVRLLIAV